MLKRIQSDTLLNDGKITIFECERLTTAAGVVVDGEWKARTVALDSLTVAAIQAAIDAPVSTDHG